MYDFYIKDADSKSIYYLIKAFKDLDLYNYHECFKLLDDTDFEIQKRGLQIVSFGKNIYQKSDIEELKKLHQFIKNRFKEKGEWSTKKQLLSTKEKEIWIYESGKANEPREYCESCSNDIYGFKRHETSPKEVMNFIEEKISLLEYYFQLSFLKKRKLCWHTFRQYFLILQIEIRAYSIAYIHLPFDYTTGSAIIYKFKIITFTLLMSFQIRFESF